MSLVIAAAPAVRLSDPDLLVGLGLLIITLLLVRARALLEAPEQPQRAPRTRR